MGLYEERKLFERYDQPEIVLNTIIDYSHKEEINAEEKENFFRIMQGVDQLCIGGCDYHYQHATIPFLELVFQLDDLKYLDMSYLRIDPIAGSEVDLFKLSNIECLLARNSGLLKLPYNINNAKKLKYLDLSRTDISTLPKCIGELVDLEDVDLCCTRIKQLPDEFTQLQRLYRLDLSYTRLRGLPDGFFDSLINLEFLNLKGTHINKLSTQTCKLKMLKKLGWGNKSLTRLPLNQLSKIPKLEFLDVSDTGLKWLQNSLGKTLPSLKGINLENTKINNSDITAISKLKNLEYLNLKRTKVSCVDDCLNLSELKYLDLSETLTCSIPDSIGRLGKLRELYLNDTHIKRLPSDLCVLCDLEVLEIENTKINQLPQDIGKLVKLQKLKLSGTLIESLPDSMSLLKNLKWLYIENMTIKELPKYILDYNLKFYSGYCGYPYNPQGIHIDGLTLVTQPVTLFEQPIDIIRAYYRNEKETISTAKVILLGYGGAGKTHTLLRILNGGRQEDYFTKKTAGIDIKSLYIKDKEITINFWDFGGQEIMYSMHRCFLTERTCYVIVIDTRRSDMNLIAQARYWLRNVATFGRGSSIIILINLWDDDVFRGIDSERLHREFDTELNIVSIIPISVKNASLEQFNHDLVDKIYDSAYELIGVGMQFPTGWNKIRSRLQQLGSGGNKYYISQKEYNKICKRYGVINRDEQIWLLKWFIDFGDCFSCFYDDALNKLDYKVLSPRWITNAIYILINKGVKYVDPLIGNGLINNTKIEELLANAAGGIADDIEGYSRKECRYIIEVMRKFELSVKAFNNEGYEFIPALLPLVEPRGIRPGNYKQCIKYLLKYDYLPDSLLKRLMVRCFNNRIVHECWGNGFTIRNDITNQTAVIYTDYQNDELRIEVYSGGHIPSNEMLSYLLKKVKDLNASLLLHAVHYIDIDIEGEEPVDVDYLLRLKARGHTIYPGMYNDFQIDLLLGLVYGDSLVVEKDLINNNSYLESLEEGFNSRKLIILNYQNCIINNGNVINTEQSL